MVINVCRICYISINRKIKLLHILNYEQIIMQSIIFFIRNIINIYHFNLTKISSLYKDYNIQKYYIFWLEIEYM